MNVKMLYDVGRFVFRTHTHTNEAVLIDVSIINRFMTKADQTSLMNYAGDPVRRLIAEFTNLAPSKVKVSAHPCYNMTLPRITFQLSVRDRGVLKRLTEKRLAELKHSLLIIIGDRLDILASEAEMAVVMA